MGYRAMNKATAFMDGFDRAFSAVSRVMQAKELADISKAQQTTDTGYTEEDGKQLEAMANAKDAEGKPYYTIGSDDKGQYTVTPNFTQADGTAAPAATIAFKPRTQFLGKTYDAPLTDEQASAARTMAMAGVFKKYGDPITAMRMEDGAKQRSATPSDSAGRPRTKSATSSGWTEKTSRRPTVMGLTRISSPGSLRTQRSMRTGGSCLRLRSSISPRRSAT